MEFNEKFIEKNIADLSKEYDLIHSANVNLARMGADLIDGLKIVQRRAIYRMFLMDGGKKYQKLGTISGSTMASFHPHSPTSISDAVVGMAQEWHNNIPLIDPDGNFGSVSGDRAGADRYIKARLSKYTLACFFDDWKDSVVDMELGQDEETMMPLYLPAKYPNVLLNGCLGIGHMGASCNIPAYNFREIAEATILLLNNPKANIVLIPDSTTGADIIQTDFHALTNKSNGAYKQRCTYEVDPESNTIRITALPDNIFANDIRSRIADIKDAGGLTELLEMNDLSGKKIDMQLVIRDDVNPYKFMRKLINEVGGLEKSYPIVITVTYDYHSYDWSIKQLLLEWIKWRKEQKRTVITNKRARLNADLRIVIVKLFITKPENLDESIKIFNTSKNRAEIEKRLIERYKNTEIHMDSLQARAISNMRMVELTTDAREGYIKEKAELEEQLKDIENILNTPNGINKEIIAELRDGIKRFGTPRKSNVVPEKISVSNDVEGFCIIQLSSDGNVIRKPSTNVEEEPIPLDNNGFACVVDNDSSFIIIDDLGNHTFIKVKELPVDTEVPVFRYTKKPLDGNIIALLPVDIETPLCCTLISKKGIVKRIRISDIGPSNKPCISLDKDDRIVRGIVLSTKSQKELLVYTRDGMGQRLDPNSIKLTSPKAKGLNGFKLKDDDEIIGFYAINPESNQYLCYMTKKGKSRLNMIEYLPVRNSKHDAMVKLISLADRDKLVSVIGCNKFDKLNVFFDDNTSEIIPVNKMEESTMSADPKKLIKKNMVSSNVVKVRLI